MFLTEKVYCIHVLKGVGITELNNELNFFTALIALIFEKKI